MNTAVRTKTQIAYQSLENHLVDKKCGLVQSLQIQFPFPGEPPIYTAKARLSYHAPDFGMRRFKVGGSGAAPTETQARLSALCESVERYCLKGDSPDIIVDSYANISQSFKALNPEDCPLFHPSQYPAVGFEPFTPETMTAWSWAVSLPGGEPILVPTDLVYIDYTADLAARPLMSTISTGAACGSSAADAVVRGIYEVVERDALMIMWLNQHPCPRVEVDPQSDLGQFIHRHLRPPNLAHHLFWTTNDLEIPACTAVLIEGQPGDQRLFVGLAANLSPERAVTNALLEAFEVRLGIFEHEEAERPITAPEAINTIHKHGVYYIQQDRTHLLDFLLNSPHTVNLASMPDKATGKPETDLAICLEQCARAGQRVLAADLTKEDVRPSGLRVVRVIMPGMQRLTTNHNSPFLGNPRLFNVPVQMGWRSTPLPLEKLNQAPHPFG